MNAETLLSKLKPTSWRDLAISAVQLQNYSMDAMGESTSLGVSAAQRVKLDSGLVAYNMSYIDLDYENMKVARFVRWGAEAAMAGNAAWRNRKDITEVADREDYRDDINFARETGEMLSLFIAAGNEHIAKLIRPLLGANDDTPSEYGKNSWQSLLQATLVEWRTLERESGRRPLQPQIIMNQILREAPTIPDDRANNIRTLLGLPTYTPSHH